MIQQSEVDDKLSWYVDLSNMGKNLKRWYIFLSSNLPEHLYFLGWIEKDLLEYNTTTP
jgi:hypothetical protein